MRVRKASALRAAAGALLIAVGATATGGTAAAADPVGTAAAGTLHATVFASGAKITHAVPLHGQQTISQPDDIAYLDHHIFVGFQNTVGPIGTAGTDGNLDSTVVEFDMAGKNVAQWDVLGKVDGVGTDTVSGKIVATVNEDGNSSLYVISPAPGSTAVHYKYNEQLPSNGGTDNVVTWDGHVLISASAPGTIGQKAPQPNYPAVYETTFNSSTHVATVHALYDDEADATVANTAGHGTATKLALTDPDSSEAVPSAATAFGGDFMLTSQADKEQIFYPGAGKPLSVLKLTQSVDDTVWPTAAGGTLYTTDNSDDEIMKITGAFQTGTELSAVTPCGAANAPAKCPAAGFPGNWLGDVNMQTGVITHAHVNGPAFQPQGMLFLP